MFVPHIFAMIIMPHDPRTTDIDAIDSLLAEGVPPAGKAFLEKERSKIAAGVAGERSTAYEIDRVFGQSDRCCVLHGLRLNIDGFTAQMDHVILSRIGVVYVCETKNFRDGLKCNEEGEWTGFSSGRAFGIASPIHQVDRHVSMLDGVLKQQHAWRPKTAGVLRAFKVHGYVLVSNRARISRPKARIPGMDRVMKLEAFDEKRNETVGMGTLLKGLFLDPVPPQALRAMGEGLASMHEPITFDWRTRMEASLGAQPGGRAQNHAATCTGCGGAVSGAESFFCRKNAQRFAGRILCRTCQTKA